MFLILFLFASADAFSRFGCTFDNANYDLSGNNDSFSDGRSELAFKSEKEYNDFYKKVDAIKKHEVMYLELNTVDSFLKMFNTYTDSKNRAPNQNLSLSDFYENYRPTYPPTGDNSIPTLMKIYEKIVSLDSRVKDSFILASKHYDVNTEDAERWINEYKTGELPPSGFHHDQVLGVIRTSVGGKPGYILIDLNDPKAPLPALKLTSSNAITTSRVDQMDSNRTYMNYRADFVYKNEFITVHTYNYVQTDSGFKEEPLYNHLIYTPRSLCSFLQSSVKRSLFYPLRSMANYFDDGSYKTFVKFNVLGRSAYLFTTIPSDWKDVYSKRWNGFPQDDGFGIELPLVLWAKEALQEEDHAYIDYVQRRFGLKGQALTEKIQQVDRAVRGFFRRELIDIQNLI